MFHNALRGQCGDVKYNYHWQEVCSAAIDSILFTVHHYSVKKTDEKPISPLSH